MQLHQIKSTTRIPKKTRVGRGGKRGKTSGKGHKGQKARAGRKMRPEWRDTIKKLPKLRGHKFKSIQEKPVPASLSLISENFTKGEAVNPQSLAAKGLIKVKGLKFPRIKILANGELAHAIVVSQCELSEKAKELILKAGGTVN